jgi:hypothetical protein
MKPWRNKATGMHLNHRPSAICGAIPCSQANEVPRLE